VPFIGVEFDEPKELPFDAFDPLEVPLIGVEVDEIEDPPFDAVNPPVEGG
jgi:hypothetical protein